METSPTFKQRPRIQGQDSIIINAPLEKIWPLIRDSQRLEDWGPPVEKIEIYSDADDPTEGVGSRRKVYARFSPKRRGWYNEIRTEQIERRKILFLIYDDSFGMGKKLEDVGASMELVPEGRDETKFIFAFYHRPKNLLGWIINPLIKVTREKEQAEGTRINQVLC